MEHVTNFMKLFGKEIAYIHYDKELWDGNTCFIIWTRCGFVFGVKYEENSFGGEYDTEYVLEPVSEYDLTNMLESNESLVKNLYIYKAISEETRDFYTLPIKERQKLQEAKDKEELEKREREMLKQLKAKYEG